MEIAGKNTNSFVDMKGMIAYIVFTPGCNFNCWYCHNRHILGNDTELLNTEEVIADIKSRKGFVDAVVISGGEPTLQSDLKEFIIGIKAMGFKIKLDTNGTRPEVIRDLLSEKLLDYVAMDIKAPFYKYEKIACSEVDKEKIEESINLLLNSEIDYEFRTTFSPDLDEADILQIAERIRGAKLYVLQQFNKHDHMTKKTFGPHSPSYIREAARKAEEYVKVLVKGIGVN